LRTSTSPHHVTLFPAVPKTVHLRLRSRLRHDVEATVSLAPPPGLCLDRTAHTVSIPAKSFAAVPVELRADSGGVYPLSATVYFEGGETVPKRWAAYRSRWGTLGVLWDAAVKENEVGWGVRLLTPEVACEPQQRVSTHKVYVYAGPGDWRTVRKHARRLAGTDGDPEPIPVEARTVHDARVEPTPLVAVDDAVTATLVVDNLRRRPRAVRGLWRRPRSRPARANRTAHRAGGRGLRRPGSAQHAAGRPHHWSTVTNPGTGRTAILVSPYPAVCLMDWGDVGGHLGCWSHVDVLPGSTTERVCYIALCESLEQAKRYACLKSYL
jgi:hypothetical protein